MSVTVGDEVKRCDESEPGGSARRERPDGLGRFVPARAAGVQWFLQTPWFVFLRADEARAEALPRCHLDDRTIVDAMGDSGAITALPQPGSMAAGRRFSGGDPSDPANWPFLG